MSGSVVIHVARILYHVCTVLYLSTNINFTL